MKNLILISILTCITLQFNAQCSLNGVVCDDGERPLPSVLVYVYGEEGQGTMTDLNGKFELNIPFDTSYTVVTSLRGHEDKYTGVNSCAVIDDDFQIEMKSIAILDINTRSYSCCGGHQYVDRQTNKTQNIFQGTNRARRKARKLANVEVKN
jgi:hypothetical protein